MPLIHATCVAVLGEGVLILGPSGSGKSDLALRLIDQGAMLVSDDQTEVQNHEGTLWASPPPTIKGMIEVRGVGLFEMAHLERTAIALIVEIADPATIDRLPEPETLVLDGLAIPKVRLAAFEASTPAKIKLWLSARAGLTKTRLISL